MILPEDQADIAQYHQLIANAQVSLSERTGEIFGMDNPLTQLSRFERKMQSLMTQRAINYAQSQSRPEPLLKTHYRQENLSHPDKPSSQVQTCVIATCRNILLALGIPQSNIPTEITLLSRIPVDKLNVNGVDSTLSTTPYTDEASLVLIDLLASFEVELRPILSLQSVVEALLMHHPVAFAKHAMGFNSHEVLIIGYELDDNSEKLQFAVADPLEDEISYLSSEEVVMMLTDLRSCKAYEASLVENQD